VTYDIGILITEVSAPFFGLMFTETNSLGYNNVCIPHKLRFYLNIL